MTEWKLWNSKAPSPSSFIFLSLKVLLSSSFLVNQASLSQWFRSKNVFFLIKMSKCFFYYLKTSVLEMRFNFNCLSFYNLCTWRKRLCKERLPESLHLVLFSKNFTFKWKEPYCSTLVASRVWIFENLVATIMKTASFHNDFCNLQCALPYKAKQQNKFLSVWNDKYWPDKYSTQPG